MRLVPAFAALWLWAILAPAVAQPEPQCALRPMARLDLQTMPDGRVTIPVKVEGHDYRFMVDTGGYINTVSHPLVGSEGYRPSHAAGALKGMGTTFLDTFITVKDFQIGNSHGRNFEFFVDDFDSISFDGTLAPEILAAYDVDFDFAHEKFNLFSPDHCPGRVVYWTDVAPAVVPMQLSDNAHIRVPVKIDGKDMMAILDTGSHTSFMSLRAASRYLDIDEKNPALKLQGNMNINGMVGPVYSYPFAAMDFGGVVVNHPHIVIVPDKVWSQTDLLVGASILRQLHMYIAYHERKLYLTPPLAARTTQ